MSLRPSTTLAFVYTTATAAPFSEAATRLEPSPPASDGHGFAWGPAKRGRKALRKRGVGAGRRRFKLHELLGNVGEATECR